MNLQLTQALSKTQIAAQADQAISELMENGKAVEAAEFLSTMEEFVKKVRGDERFIDLVVEEAQKYKGKMALATGTKLEVCETGVSYDYSENPAWVELKQQETQVAEQRKALEKRLQAIPAGRQMVDPETGETFTGPIKTSKTNFRLTLSR